MKIGRTSATETDDLPEGRQMDFDRFFQGETDEKQDELLVKGRKRYRKDVPYHLQGYQGKDEKLPENLSEYAPFSVRILAGIIDMMILIPASCLLTMLATNTAEGIGTIVLAFSLTFFVLAGFYYTYLEGPWKQASIGKQILGLYIVTDQIEPLTYGQSLMRYLLKLFATATILGVFMPMMSARRQGFHDSIIHCYVLRGMPK